MWEWWCVWEERESERERERETERVRERLKEWNREREIEREREREKEMRCTESKNNAHHWFHSKKYIQISLRESVIVSFHGKLNNFFSDILYFLEHLLNEEVNWEIVKTCFVKKLKSKFTICRFTPGARPRFKPRTFTSDIYPRHIPQTFTPDIYPRHTTDIYPRDLPQTYTL